MLQISASLALMYLHKYVKFAGVTVYNATELSPVLITALVFLACKATEQLRTIRDVFNVVSRVFDESITAQELDAVRPIPYVRMQCPE